MKTYLLNIYINQELNEKLSELELELSANPSDCDCIIYDCPIEDVFKEPIKVEKIRTIISKSEFLKAEKLKPRNIIKKNIRTILFENESVSEVSDKIKKSLSDIVDNNSFEDHSRYMSLVAIEMVQNALIYKKNNGGEDKVELTMVEGEDYYSICVSDPFGALTDEIFLTKVIRAFREKTPENKSSGAGLGFSMILAASDEFVLRSQRNKKTKVCSIMHKYKRLKDYKRKSPTVYLREGV